jgi:hypothetical protein
VVRAAIMGGLFVLALYLGRQAEVRTSLIFAATVMTTANLCLRWDVGLPATVRLIWLTPPLEQVTERGAVNYLQLVQQLLVRITQEGPIRAPGNPASRWWSAGRPLKSGSVTTTNQSNPRAANQRSALIAAWHPWPAEETTCRNTGSCTSPAAKTPGTLVIINLSVIR